MKMKNRNILRLMRRANTDNITKVAMKLDSLMAERTLVHNFEKEVV